MTRSLMTRILPSIVRGTFIQLAVRGMLIKFVARGTLIALGVATAHVAAMAQDLPVPPIPPANPPLADVAPVPNPDAQAPVPAASDTPSIDVRLYRAKAYDPSLGFAPGSRYQTAEDRKPIQTPGLSISVPIK